MVNGSGMEMMILVIWLAAVIINFWNLRIRLVKFTFSLEARGKGVINSKVIKSATLRNLEHDTELVSVIHSEH